MPQFKPTFICIPKEIKADPEKFGLHQNYWPAADYPSLDEVESCNQIALQENATAMLDDKQWERYTKAVAIILGFQRLLEQEEHSASPLQREEAYAKQTKNDIEVMEAKIK